mmetsp:Transcript_14405/g.39571  ORF Transcript_14405/g.39571 Transcript_14405/m.39571 type:complete len:310 (+) Transcript_14405:104-1033(+)
MRFPGGPLSSPCSNWFSNSPSSPPQIISSSGLGPWHLLHASRMGKLMFPQPGHAQFPSTPATGAFPLPPPPLAPAAAAPPPQPSNTDCDFGPWHRLHDSRTAKFTFLHCTQAQFPSTPAIGAPPRARPVCCWKYSCGFGIWQRLHAFRMAKLTFEQFVHAQFPSRPAIGGPLPPFCGAACSTCASKKLASSSNVDSSCGFGVWHLLHEVRIGKLMFEHIGHAQFPSSPAIGAPPCVRPPWCEGSMCCGASISSCGLGVWQRLQEVRMPKLMFWQTGHPQFPSTPAVGAPPGPRLLCCGCWNCTSWGLGI